MRGVTTSKGVAGAASQDWHGRAGVKVAVAPCGGFLARNEAVRPGDEVHWMHTSTIDMDAGRSGITRPGGKLECGALSSGIKRETAYGCRPGATTGFKVVGHWRWLFGKVEVERAFVHVVKHPAELKFAVTEWTLPFSANQAVELKLGQG